MALSKEEMAVALAKLEWQLESIVLNVETWTKADTERQLRTLLVRMNELYKQHIEKRPRATKSETKENDETVQNEQAQQSEELPEEGKPDAQI